MLLLVEGLDVQVVEDENEYHIRQHYIVNYLIRKEQAKEYP